MPDRRPGCSLAIAAAALLAPAVATAHPLRAISPDGQAPVGGFVATEARPDGVRFARQVLPANGTTADAVAESRVLYLNHTGVTLSPGDNDSMAQTSTIITERVTIDPWQTDLWPDVMGCMTEIYARFDVTVTDVDPGNTPHIEAVFGGAPADIGLSSDIGGVSPFTTDCGIIDNSIVFAFTSNLPNDAREVCEVMAQEIAHSYGLDHEMLASDPMTYLDYTGDREFADSTAPCGEFTARACGINGSTCRAGQDSVALLTSRVGLAGSTTSSDGPADGEGSGEITGGCDAGHTGGGSGALALGLGAAIAAVVGRRRRRA